jgi:hypothetical protein
MAGRTRHGVRVSVETSNARCARLGRAGKGIQPRMIEVNPFVIIADSPIGGPPHGKEVGADES